METAARRAMTTWVGALARSGVLEHPSEDEAAGEAVAAYVVGAERLDELRDWFAGASADEATRERRAAVEAVIAMAQSDREVHVEERHLLRSLVGQSGLPADVQDELVMRVHEPAGIAGIETRLTSPVLRELILALAWELALADGRIDDAEKQLYAQLAVRFGIDADRAQEIADAVSEQV